MILNNNIIFGGLCDKNMDVSVHYVEKITMKRKMLTGGHEVLSIYIDNDTDTHEIVMFSNSNEVIKLDFRGIGIE